MANYCNAKIKFEGNKEQLEKIEKLLIKTGRFSELTLDYSYVEPMLPGIENKFIFQLFGCDWYKFVGEEYSEEEKNKFTSKVQNFIKNEGWIGLRDGYINEPARNVSTSRTENNLNIDVTFSWYCPTLFFFKIAQDFHVNVKILEFVEGNNTIISHFDENGECVDILNSNENILNNEKFRNLSIELGLHKPSDIIVTALISERFDVVKELANAFSITDNDIKKSIKDLLDYAEDSCDTYQSSTFVNLNIDILKEINIDEKIQLFNNVIHHSFLPKNK